MCYFKCTLVPEALCKANETKDENGEPLVASGPYAGYFHQWAVRPICQKIPNIQRIINDILKIIKIVSLGEVASPAPLAVYGPGHIDCAHFHT